MIKNLLYPNEWNIWTNVKSSWLRNNIIKIIEYGSESWIYKNWDSILVTTFDLFNKLNEKNINKIQKAW